MELCECYVLDCWYAFLSTLTHFEQADTACPAMLNCQWSLTAGPQTIFEILSFWALVGFGLYGGAKYFRMGWYQPLIPLWYATFFSMAGYFMVGRGEATISIP